ncbi:MAG: polysaccharide deacetylase family protein [Methylotetracoccus sp.]
MNLAAGGSYRPTPFVRASAALHLGALGLGLASPEYWSVAVGAIAVDQAVLTLAGLWPRSSLLGANWTRLPTAAAHRGQVALTFDDGPDPEVTPRVLDLLAQCDARATFFCIGQRAAAFPDLCREIVTRGHAVENHSHRHAHGFAFSGLRGFQQELELAQQTIAAITGVRPRFFRAPAGLRNPLLDPVLHRAELTLASWTRRGFDTRERDADVVRGRLLHGIRAGDILLLHDGNAARTRSGIPVVLEVLPGVLDRLAALSLSPVTLASVL